MRALRPDFCKTGATGLGITWGIMLLLIVVTLAVFWPVHSHEFILWDDNKTVYENPALRSFTLDHLLRFWRAPHMELYIPFTYMLWALTAAVSRWVTQQPTGGAPLDPQLFHSLNLLVHLVTVLVVWRLVRLLLSRTLREGQSAAHGHTRVRVEWAACSGALLFAVHPLQVEAVAWVSGFKDVLCGCLSCVAIWQYLCYASGSGEAAPSDQPSLDTAPRPLGHYWLATGVFVLALLAKPTAVVVPVVAWLLDVWGWPRTWRIRRPAVLAWLVLATLWGVFTTWVQPATNVLFTVPLWTRPLIAGDAVAFYLYKCVFPFWLGVDYGRTPEVVLAQSWLWFTGLVPWGLAGWLWCKRAQVPWLATTAGVGVAGLLPVLGFIPFEFQNYSTVADHYMYMAMLGPALALAWGLAQSSRRVLTIGCVVVMGVWGMRSAWQTRYWHTTISLFEHTLTVNPGSAVAHNNLGLALTAQNRITEAVDHYTEALRLLPSYALAHYNLGHLLSRQGQTQEAIRHYTAAVRLLPTYAEAHNNLGLALANQGRSPAAIAHYTEALRLQPWNADAHNNLGNALLSQGQIPEAMHHYTEALHLQPDFAEAHNNLGTALTNQGRAAEAIAHYTEALRLQPSYARAHYNLGNVLNKQGQTQEAIQHYTEALRLQPTLAEAHHNLGVTLADQGHIDEAIAHHTEALRLRPRYVNAHYNLGVALVKQGRLAEARQHFAEVLRLDPTHTAARRFLERSGQ
jgi:tetratricopeptide (TPR) repeat protein